jgi:hypothetical protein
MQRLRGVGMFQSQCLPNTWDYGVFLSALAQRMLTILAQRHKERYQNMVNL